ncbi:zinc finger protein 391-like [Xyrauchen texanus]|uniref:zinc finger protein 391-like n=1 Tax=Xyrauchen texanus TaxID=154827 RepID=UPI0022421FA1|nr:zinc finger protein 391-like [Xyrauchen texanus]
MREQVDVICCKSVGTDLSMLDIDDFITEISQLKKEVTSLKTKLMERDDRLQELENVSCQSSVCVTDGTSTECQDSVWSGRDQSTPQRLLDKLSEQRSRDTQDSQLTLLCSTDGNQGDQTSTECLTSVCNAGEQEMLQTPVKMCSVKLQDFRNLMKMRESTAEEQQSNEDDDDYQTSTESLTSVCYAGEQQMLQIPVKIELKLEEIKEENTAEEQQRDEDDFISSDLMELKEEHQELNEVEERLQYQKPDLITVEESLSCSKTRMSFSLKKPQRAAKFFFTCSPCGKSFTCKSQLNTHMRVHTGEESYTCHQCGKSSADADHLKDHLCCHSGDQCGKSLADAGHLKDHLCCYSGERSFECDICGKTFVLDSCLKRHLKLHLKEKPYKCSICGKSFPYRSYFKEHQKVHTGVRAHLCFECGKTFTTAIHLNRHQRIHTGEKPYKCSHCGKSFNLSQNLKTHERIHTGEKPYKCSHCGKGFARSQCLKRHERIHTGEKPYKCSHCGKSFNQSAHLQQHVKKYCPSSHSEQK